MKLYYSPGACSLSPHIIAREAGIALELIQVDLQTKLAANGETLSNITPKAYVPALVLDDGAVLTEGPVIAQYLADLAPASALMPAHGSLARYQLQATLGYINSELHKSFTPLFNPATPESVREERKAYLCKRYAWLDARLQQQPWLEGAHFTVADAYLFVVTSWAGYVDLDLSAFAALAEWRQRVSSRPAVQAAMRAEGLIPA